MRAVVQRVRRASVTVVAGAGDQPTAAGTGEIVGEIVGEIGAGLCVLVGVTHDDDEGCARRLADKVWNLRIFDDADGVMNRALSDGVEHADGAGGDGGDGGDDRSAAPGVLVVSQFTLYGETARGRRPSWIAAARPEQAEPLIDVVVERLRELASPSGAVVATGRFRTDMVVEIINDGPVTVIVEI
jgi:D-tyrosyl-tRNA(Tyr) deacylase